MVLSSNRNEVNLRDSNNDSSNGNSATSYQIAIVGIGCRFPGGANSPEDFWRVVCDQTDAITDVPTDRWDIRTFYDPDPTKPGKTSTCRGGFIENIYNFDAQFFGISPREAALLDPQQRLLLEVCWEAFEDAGILPEYLAGSNTGVFMGGFTLDYKILQFSESNYHLMDSHTATGSMMTLLANRLSYMFDLRGPSISLDTACSSSLVAVHLACQSILNGECDLALAGGVNVMIKPNYTIAESKAGMLSPDGRSKAYDSLANGYVRGEGAGIVVLKPLSKALEDNDPIYAVIRGTAVNQDGHSSGITVPRRESQEALLREAYRRAGVLPAQVQYVEAHGTGTPVGDPLEANALGTVLSTERPDGQECYIASVKTNIGHTEAAAGVAGLIKASLVLKHRKIPAHLHFQKANPDIDFPSLKLKIPTSLVPFPETDGFAIAGVNSFGFGGTNAHAVLQEAPITQISIPGEENLDPNWGYLLPLSARSPQALQDLARAYHKLLTDGVFTNNTSLHNFCYTASLRRTHHQYRLAVVGNSYTDMADLLAAFLNGESRAEIAIGNKAIPKNQQVVFVFSGMGPQWWAMGRQLLMAEPIFRQTIEECDTILQYYADWSLLTELTRDEEHSRIEETQIAQPANFAIQVALAALWRSWGIEPSAIVGHSAGEPAAAYVAGALSLKDALKVVFHRSRLQQQTAGQGKMAAIGLSYEEAQQLLVGYEDRLSIAAINSPTSVTLSGNEADLETINKVLEDRKVFFRLLRVNVAYHSPTMNPLKEELLEVLQDIEPQTPIIPLWSTVTGEKVDRPELNEMYWWQNMRQPVFFAASMNKLAEAGYDLFLEISPHPVLAGSISECFISQNRQATVLTSIRRKEAERQIMLTSLAALYTQGCKVSWQSFYPYGQHVYLPLYTWQRERYWHESPASEQLRLGKQVHPLLGQALELPYPSWKLDLNKRYLAYLDDHRIQNAVVYPGAAYVEMGLAVAKRFFGEGIYSVDNIEFKKALFLPEKDLLTVQLTLDPKDASFSVYTRQTHSQNDWTLHAQAKLHLRQFVTKCINIHEIRNRCSKEVSKPDLYHKLGEVGFQYGPQFQRIEQIWLGATEALGQIHMPDLMEINSQDYELHPIILDSCFHVLIAIASLGDINQHNSSVYLPISIQSVRVYNRPRPNMWAHARVIEQGDKILTGELQLFDEEGNLLAEVLGFQAQSIESAGKGLSPNLDSWLYELEWQPKPRVNDENTPQNSFKEQPGSWFIFADQGGVAQRLVTQLRERGENCIIVVPGESYQALEPGHYSINPSHPDEFQNLLQDAIDNSNLPCRGLIHLWSLDTVASETMTVDALESEQLLGCGTILHLIQALVQSGWRNHHKLWVVTRGTQPVADSEIVSLAPASLWGLSRVASYQEHTNIWGGIIDLDPVHSDDEISMLLEEVWNPDNEDQIAFRNQQRYCVRLVSTQKPTSVFPSQFRPDSSYLITGGLGDLGILVAHWLVERGARHLILVGRDKFPSRQMWNQLEADSRFAVRISVVRELEAMGASVHLAAVDVANEAEVAEFLDTYQQENWPPIRGVIHSAGLVRDELLLNMELKNFNSVLRPKALGAWVLHRLFENVSLDFFVLFSSVASVVGTMGQGNYAAGNSFMDSLVHYRRSKGLPALSINWGPWGEVGMASRLDLTDYYAQRGIGIIRPNDGIEILSRLLNYDLPQVTVVPANWALVANLYPTGTTVRIISDLLAEAQEKSTIQGDTTVISEGHFIQQIFAAEASQQTSLLETHIQELISQVLRIDLSRLNSEQSLNALGLDSMMAIELKQRIEISVGASIAVVDLLKGSNIREIVTILMPQIQENQRLVSQEEISEMLTELQQLSPEETERLLAQMEQQ